MVISTWPWFSRTVCGFERKGEWICVYAVGAEAPGTFSHRSDTTVMASVVPGDGNAGLGWRSSGGAEKRSDS